MSWPSMLFVKQQMVDAAAKRVNVPQEIFLGVRRLAPLSRSQRQKPLSYVLFLGRVIALAGQHFQVVVGHVDFDFAKFSVVCSVRRIVAERVLATQLLGNLIERFGEMFFGIDRNGAAAGLF